MLLLNVLTAYSTNMQSDIHLSNVYIMKCLVDMYAQLHTCKVDTIIFHFIIIYTIELIPFIFQSSKHYPHTNTVLSLLIDN